MARSVRPRVPSGLDRPCLVGHTVPACKSACASVSLRVQVPACARVQSGPCVRASGCVRACVCVCVGCVRARVHMCCACVCPAVCVVAVMRLRACVCFARVPPTVQGRRPHRQRVHPFSVSSTHHIRKHTHTRARAHAHTSVLPPEAFFCLPSPALLNDAACFAVRAAFAMHGTQHATVQHRQTGAIAGQVAPHELYVVGVRIGIWCITP
jgi:hypothetical protein